MLKPVRDDISTMSKVLATMLCLNTVLMVANTIIMSKGQKHGQRSEDSDPQPSGEVHLSSDDLDPILSSVGQAKSIVKPKSQATTKSIMEVTQSALNKAVGDSRLEDKVGELLEEFGAEMIDYIKNLISRRK